MLLLLVPGISCMTACQSVSYDYQIYPTTVIGHVHEEVFPVNSSSAHWNGLRKEIMCDT